MSQEDLIVVELPLTQFKKKMKRKEKKWKKNTTNSKQQQQQQQTIYCNIVLPKKY